KIRRGLSWRQGLLANLRNRTARPRCVSCGPTNTLTFGETIKRLTRFTTLSAYLLIFLAAAAAADNAPKRGRYLVQIGGCNECHTPWVFNEALNMPVPDMSRYLSGHPADAPDPGGTPGREDVGLIGPTFTSFKMPFGIVYSPNLTPDKD